MENNMTDKPSNKRKSPRAQWIYYDGGIFFVTICTHNRIHFFGEIEHGEIKLSRIGEIVNNELSNPKLHHKDIEIPLFCVMPNHIHAIIALRNNSVSYRDISERNPNPSYRANSDMARHVPTLTKYIGSFKSAVTRYARKINPNFKWQPRYHDHLIRGNRDAYYISDYIINNPLRWDIDCFNQ